MKKEKGESDYDYEYDILYFKAKNRDYKISTELDNIVVDFDKNKQVMGIQILEASKFLRLTKQALRNIPYWQFTVEINNGIIEISLIIKVELRNKILEKNPIIKHNISKKVPNSELVCEA